jgi:hypothetical protein
VTWWLAGYGLPAVLFTAPLWRSRPYVRQALSQFIDGSFYRSSKSIRIAVYIRNIATIREFRIEHLRDSSPFKPRGYK